MLKDLPTIESMRKLESAKKTRLAVPKKPSPGDEAL